MYMSEQSLKPDPEHLLANLLEQLTHHAPVYMEEDRYRIPVQLKTTDPYFADLVIETLANHLQEQEQISGADPALTTPEDDNASVWEFIANQNQVNKLTDITQNQEAIIQAVMERIKQTQAAFEGVNWQAAEAMAKEYLKGFQTLRSLPVSPTVMRTHLHEIATPTSELAIDALIKILEQNNCISSHNRVRDMEGNAYLRIELSPGLSEDTFIARQTDLLSRLNGTFANFSNAPNCKEPASYIVADGATLYPHEPTIMEDLPPASRSIH